MNNSYVVILFLYIITYCIADKLSWCEYWYKRGVSRGECTRPRQYHWSIVTRSPTIENSFQSMPICDVVTNWGRCQRSDHCPQGLLCWVSGNACCTPNNIRKMLNSAGYESNTCPHPVQMGIECNSPSPVNWCNSDTDCHMTNALQKCCATPCGYNMCIRTQLPVDMNARLNALSIVPLQCPPMDILPITCSVTHGVSWCNSDDQCYNNGAQLRKCCPTRCGYNVCLLKISDNKWMIA